MSPRSKNRIIAKKFVASLEDESRGSLMGDLPETNVTKTLATPRHSPHSSLYDISTSSLFSATGWESAHFDTSEGTDEKAEALL